MVGIGNDSDCITHDKNCQQLYVGDIIMHVLRSDQKYTVVGGNQDYIFASYGYEKHDGTKYTNTTRLNLWDVQRNYTKKQKDKPLVIWPYKN